MQTPNTPSVPLVAESAAPTLSDASPSGSSNGVSNADFGSPNFDSRGDFDVEAARSIASAPGVPPQLRAAIGAIIEATTKARDEKGASIFREPAMAGAAAMRECGEALILADELVNQLRDQFLETVMHQREHLRRELEAYNDIEIIR